MKAWIRGPLTDRLKLEQVGLQTLLSIMILCYWKERWRNGFMCGYKHSTEVISFFGLGQMYTIVLSKHNRSNPHNYCSVSIIACLVIYTLMHMSHRLVCVWYKCIQKIECLKNDYKHTQRSRHYSILKASSKKKRKKKW